ncbi:hypothetical protein AACH06_27145 [Ideonella sp. DXS29W]|uniref:Tetratricopeptide repeat protein n=1 Tax=Ideonella lacteola TaxID=2984193 RepID=A0ABU9BX16_9BURK
MRLRALLDRGESQRASELAQHSAAAEAEPMAEALCATGQADAGIALLDRINVPSTPGPDSAETATSAPPSLQRAQWLAVRGLCALAAGDRPQARALAAQARDAFDAQPAAHAAYRRVLQRLIQGLDHRAANRPSATG